MLTPKKKQPIVEFPAKKFLRSWAVTMTIGSLPMTAAFAQDKSEAVASERPPIHFQVLQGWKIDLGNRSIFLNRVAPPVLSPAPLAPPPAPAPTAGEVAKAEAEEARTPQKKSEVLFLSATVYDRSVTEVRSFGGEREYSFLTNIDFNLLAGVASFETADTAYLLILGVGNESHEEVEAFNKRAAEQGESKEAFKRIPPLETFSKTRSEYVIAEDEPNVQPPAETLAALDALHVFYDTNRERLAEGYAKREVARVGQERWLKENPPVPKDTVVNFWPGKNTVILEGQRKGAKP